MFAKKEVEYLNALNRQYREAKLKIENRDKFIEQQEKELEKYKEFAMVVENLVNGKRKPEDIVDRIKKELLSLR